MYVRNLPPAVADEVPTPPDHSILPLQLSGLIPGLARRVGYSVKIMSYYLASDNFSHLRNVL